MLASSNLPYIRDGLVGHLEERVVIATDGLVKCGQFIWCKLTDIFISNLEYYMATYRS